MARTTPFVVQVNECDGLARSALDDECQLGLGGFFGGEGGTGVFLGMTVPSWRVEARCSELAAAFGGPEGPEVPTIWTRFWHPNSNK